MMNGENQMETHKHVSSVLENCVRFHFDGIQIRQKPKQANDLLYDITFESLTVLSLSLFLSARDTTQLISYFTNRQTIAFNMILNTIHDIHLPTHYCSSLSLRNDK